MVDGAQGARVQVGLHGLGRAGKAEMLRRHQSFTGGIPGSDHLANFAGLGRQRFFAQHVFARVQRRDCQRSVIVVRRANVNDVDGRVVDQLFRSSRQAGNAEFLAPRLEGRFAHVAPRDNLSMLG